MQAVGYIRISTTLKRQDEQALTNQETKIREACLGAGFQLTQIYEDIGSACPTDSLKQRPGLQDALFMASQQNAIIIVTEPSRLFRNPDEALKVSQAYPKVQFWSVQHHAFLPTDILLTEVAAAASEAEATRIGTSKAQIARGFTGPDRDAKLRGSQASVKQRKLIADQRIMRLAKVIEPHDKPNPLTHEQAAQLFNSKGLRTSQLKRWTKGNVRRDLKAARMINREIAEILALEGELLLAA